LNGCPAEIGNGNVVSQERQASTFFGVTHEGVGDVNIHYAENYKVVVTTDSNIKDIITTKVDKNNLYIGLDRKIKKSLNPTKLIIDVYMPELRNINLRGVGNINVQDFEVENIDVILSGSGDLKIISGNVSNFKINLSGVGDMNIQNLEAENVDVTHTGSGDLKINSRRTSDFRISLRGVGDVEAQNFEAENVVVTHTGSGDLKVWVTKSLTGNISGVGDVLYKGDPPINDVKRTGNGDVKKL
jgi:hypothetical protein